MYAAQVRELKCHGHLLDKGSFLGNRVYAVHRDIRAAYGNHHPRQSCAGTHVQQARGMVASATLPQRGQLPLQGRDDRKTIHQVMGQHLVGVTDCCEVVDPGPLLDKGKVVQQGRHLRGRQRHPHILTRLQQPFRVRGHAHAAAAFSTKPRKLPFLR